MDTFKLSQSFSLLLVATIVLAVCGHWVLRDMLYLSGMVYITSATGSSARRQTLMNEQAARPSPIFNAFMSLQRLRAGFPYLVRGPELISQGYEQGNGAPFTVQTPTNKHVFVSSALHIRELDMHSSQQLSLHAAAKEILQPKYTYTDHVFEWPDQRGQESIGFNRALRSLLTASLPTMLPTLQQALAAEFDARMTANGQVDRDGYIEFPIAVNVKRIITVLNSVVFFGEVLSRNEELTDALLRYMDMVPLCGELVKIVPGFSAPFICKLVTGSHRDYKIIYRALAPVVEERLRQRARGEEPPEKPFDGIQWLIDTSPKKKPWSTTRAVDEVIAVWFSSVPQLASVATYAIHDLSIHPDWKQKLLTELRSHDGYSAFLQSAKGLPLMECFIKESTRMSPIDGVTCRRKVTGHVEFSNGPKVAAGDWVSVPQQAMWRDERFYPNPTKFDPFRFFPSNDATQSVNGPTDGRERGGISELTEVSPSWVLWGFGRTACPGRFFATFAMKLLLSHTLLNYEIKPQESTKRHFTWRSVNVPSGDAKILLKTPYGADEQH